MTSSGKAISNSVSAPADSAKGKPPRLTEAEKQRWMEENREAFASYNDFVKKNGVFGDKSRLF